MTLDPTPKQTKPRLVLIGVHVTPETAEWLKIRAAEDGYKGRSEFLRATFQAWMDAEAEKS